MKTWRAENAPDICVSLVFFRRRLTEAVLLLFNVIEDKISYAQGSIVGGFPHSLDHSGRWMFGRIFVDGRDELSRTCGLESCYAGLTV